MRRKGSRRGRAGSVLIAAGVGYLIGSWHVAALRSSEPTDPSTAAQSVALRFPRALSDAPVIQAASYAGAVAVATAAMDDAQLALFEPKPMVPPSAEAQIATAPVPQQTADLAPPVPVQAAPERTADTASERAAPPPPQSAPERTASIAPTLPVRPETAAASIAPRAKEPAGAAAAKLHPLPARHEAERHSHMLDEAQIAGIRRRLHLTPEQEHMWPAVEAALRNVGVASAHEAHGRGAPAALDPNSAEVQDLKSAAIPLLMSFSDQQKDEVRNLARGMGLNQLASEF
jgi:hypothetical protein